MKRNVEAEHSGGVEIDDELELRGLLDQQVGRLLAFEDAVNVAGGTPELIGLIGPVGN